MIATWFREPRNFDLLFFGSIAGLDDARIFRDRFRAATDEELESYLLLSIHGKARKARAKFTALFCAAVATMVSLALFGVGVAPLLLP